MKILAVLVLFVGVSWAEEFLVRCKRPVDCVTPCDYYQTDKNGCEICQCMEDPCKDNPCPENNACFADEDACDGKYPCTELPARCVEVHRKPTTDEAEPCPLTMCRMKCEYGFRKNDRGCELCDCHDPCEGHECGEQENCQVVKEMELFTAKCKARPLCHRVHDNFLKQQESLMAEPRCTSDGEFEPVQCHQTSGECWCVDDRGIEIPGTRGSTKPTCESRHCHHAHVGFDLKHSMESIQDEIDKLQKEMEKQLSQVMTIEQEFIDQVIVSPQGIDVVHVEFDVVRRPIGNGVILTEVDVATTVYHLDRKIRNGDVIIIYGNDELAPIPESLQVEHNYGEPQLPADGPLREYPEKTWSGRCYGVYRRHKVAFIAAAIGTILCMFFLIYVLAVAMRKKKVIRKQKEKQMRTYKENLAFNNQLYDKMVLPTNDDVEEKKPLDELNTVSVA